MTKLNGKPRERVARAKTVMAAQKRAEQRLMDLKRVRSLSPNGPRSRSISAPRDAFKRPCWSIHPHINRIKRDELIEMVIDLMTDHGRAKSWPITSDLFGGESSTVMQHIRAKGWLQQHIAPWCEEAMMIRGHIELKKCPPGGFYPRGRSTKA